MTAPPDIPLLRLEPVAGPQLDTYRSGDTDRVRLGRGQDCDFALLDPAVSREHAAIEYQGQHWLITDLGSRHGTTVNAVSLEPGDPTALEPGDLVGIGPWTLRASIGSARPQRLTANEAPPVDATIVEPLTTSSSTRLAGRQLTLLMECARALGQLAAEDEMVSTILDAAIAGSTFRRAAILRTAEDDAVEIVGYRDRDGHGAPTFSRSLLRAASEGTTARLSATPEVAVGASIAELGITSALCAPVHLGNAIAAYLYVDASRPDAHSESEASGFCSLLARLYGLTLANAKRADLEQRHARIQDELAAAHEAQRLFVPARTGLAAGARFAISMLPGHVLAGDLFDIVDPGDGTLACVIGDVTGGGVDAAVLMAASQSHLHGALAEGLDPAAAVTRLNRYLAARSPLNRFVTLWVGRLHPATRTLVYVDAGHGHWLIRRSDGTTHSPREGGGIPVGIDGAFEYLSGEVQLDTDDRVILFTDGLTEQVALDGEEFGRERVVGELRESAGVEADVERLLAAVTTFAGRRAFADDVTVASVALA